jgi:hypothetical protein
MLIIIDDWIWIVVRMGRFKISERYTQILKIVDNGYKANLLTLAKKLWICSSNLYFTNFR